MAAAAALVAVGLASAASCGGVGGGAPAPRTATESPDAGRHPDGVLIDPPAAMPSAAPHARARGVVALREPLGADAARALVLQMVSALEHDDTTALEPLLDLDAAYYDSGHRLARGALLEKWRQRMSQLPYARLAGVEIVRRDAVRVFPYEDLGGPGEPSPPPEMQPGDVYVIAPAETTRIGTDKYFPSAWQLVLRPHEEKFLIAGYEEIEND